MIDISIIVTLAIVVTILAVVLVMFLLVRTTRKEVDKNTDLSQILMDKESSGVSIASVSPVDQIKHDITCMENQSVMDDTQLMAWMDAKMDELGLYQQPDMDLKTVSETLGISQRRILRIPDDTQLSLQTGGHKDRV